jgi:hypothetical protein
MQLHSERFRQRRPVSQSLTGLFAFSVQEFAVVTALQRRVSLVRAHSERLFMVRNIPLHLSLCQLAVLIYSYLDVYMMFFQYGTGRASVKAGVSAPNRRSGY